MRRAHRITAIALAIAATTTACGKQAEPHADPQAGAQTSTPAAAPTVQVGAYTAPVPSGWRTEPAERDGRIALQTVARDPAVTIVLSRAPEPLPFDPTDPVACADNGRALGDVIGAPAVIALPAGPACAVRAARGARRTSTVVLAADGHGLMAQCMYRDEADVSECDAIFERIARAR